MSTETACDFDPSGTAFAITSKHAITAHHNIFDDVTETEFKRCILSYRTAKEGEKYTFEEPICVTLVASDADTDCAIFQTEEDAISFSRYFLSKLLMHYLMNILLWSQLYTHQLEC